VNLSASSQPMKIASMTLNLKGHDKSIVVIGKYSSQTINLS
jgi:hypothetical protein